MKSLDKAWTQHKIRNIQTSFVNILTHRWRRVLYLNTGHTNMLEIFVLWKLPCGGIDDSP